MLVVDASDLLVYTYIESGGNHRDCSKVLCHKKWNLWNFITVFSGFMKEQHPKGKEEKPTCQKVAFQGKLSLRYVPSYALMTPYKSF